jgi:flagellar biosynthesis regulator FlbT
MSELNRVYKLIDGIHKFYKFKELEDKIGLDNDGIYFAEQINEQGAKIFYYADTYDVFQQFIQVNESASFHELILFTDDNGASIKNKMYFDVDLKLIKSEANEQISEFAHKFIEHFIHTYSQEEIEDLQIIECNTPRSDKFSAHYIINVACTREENLLFAILLNKQARICNIVDKGIDLVDLQAYKARSQSLRIAGFAKYGDNARKILPASVSLHESLICIRDFPIEELELTDAANELMDVFVHKKRSLKVSDTAAARPQMSLSTLETILDALDIKRATVTEFWRNICFICGQFGEDARPLMHKWAAKAKNYDRAACDFAFSRSNGRITVGTLMYYLRDDAPHLYDDIRQELRDVPTNEMPKEAPCDRLARYIKNQLTYKTREDICDRFSKYYNTKLVCSRYLDAADIRSCLASNNSLYICSPMGTGKTEAIKEICAEMKTCLFMTYRRSLATDVKCRFDDIGFADYRHIAQKITDGVPRLICQLDSVPRIEWTAAPELLILDEIAGLREQLLTRSNCTNYTRSQLYAKFTTFVKLARRVIVMDANLSHDDIEFIQAIREQDCAVLHNTYEMTNIRKSKNYITTEFNQFYAHIKADIKEGKNIILASNYSNIKLEVIRNKLLLDCSTLTANDVLLITQQTQADEDVKAAIADVNGPDGFAKYKVVIYSPSIQAGVSFNREHFHAFYGYWVSSSSGVSSVRQMIHRVRKFIDCRYTHYIKQVGAAAWSSNKSEFVRYLSSGRVAIAPDIEAPEFVATTYDLVRGYQYDTANPYFQNYISIMTRRAKDKNAYMYNFIYDELNSGFVERFDILPDLVEAGDDPDADEKKINLDAKNKRVDELQKIVGAPNINDETFEILVREKERGEILPPEQFASYKKHKLRLYYDCPRLELGTAKSIKEMMGARAKNAYKFTRQLYQYADVQHGLYKLRADLDAGRFRECDFDEKYTAQRVYNMHVIGQKFLRIAGFSNILDDAKIKRSDLERKIVNGEIMKLIKVAAPIFFVRASRIPAAADKRFKAILAFINNCLFTLYHVKIGAVNHHQSNYNIKRSKLFNYGAAKNGKLPDVIPENRRVVDSDIVAKYGPAPKVAKKSIYDFDPTELFSDDEDSDSESEINEDADSDADSVCSDFMDE